jgi:hypothetical protein
VLSVGDDDLRLTVSTKKKKPTLTVFARLRSFAVVRPKLALYT